MRLTERQNILKAKSDSPRLSEPAMVRRHRPDYKIVVYMGLLMLLGLIIMYAIGPQRANVLNNAYGSNYSDTYFFVKQAISLGLSLAAFIFMAFIPYKLVIKHSGKLLLFGLVACALLAVASWAGLSIAQPSLGATRWFNLGSLGSLQPSEILKFAILLFIACFYGSKLKQGKQNDFRETLIPIAIVTGIAMLFVVVIQKDLGTGISLLGIIMTILFVGCINKRNIGFVVLALLAVGVMFVLSEPHRIERVQTFLRGDDTSVSDSDSYHIEQARLAIGSGGLFGVGIGNSVQSTGYLPEATNDSVFAIMGETFGFVGLVVILGLFTALMYRLLRQIDYQIDERLRLIIAGTFGWLCSHVILNVASMTGLIPLTGITLPLLSFGGTSMLFFSAALGLVFQLSRYSVYSSNVKENQYENPSSRRGIGRSRYAGRSSITRN